VSRCGLLLVAALSFSLVAAADEKSDELVRKYRETLKDASPGELYVIMGEELWRAPRGPRKVSLERCDFGLGPGVLKGAYAQLPRYFADTDTVEDVESRLATCMASLQGYTAKELPRHGFGDPRMADFLRLASYVAAQSNGMKLAPPLSHPKEVDAYRIGELLFYRRAGSHDFSCATCHAVSGKRVRLQRLTNLADAQDARQGFPSWPAYRPTAGDVHTMQLWLGACMYQTRHPQLVFGSEASIALQVYMAQHAAGGVIAVPGVRR
jgi:L-cysteine S-thiosulfotransferase